MPNQVRNLILCLIALGMVAYPRSVHAQDNRGAFLPLVLVSPLPVYTMVTPQPDWTAQWWQWIERTQNYPVYQEGQVDCSVGQTGEVWFLASTEGGPPVERRCTVPKDKTLVVPILTVAWANEGDENLTVPEKRSTLEAIFSDSEPGLASTKLCHLRSRINGADVDVTRVQSPPFPSIGDPEAAADGYWFAFNLEPGKYTVDFSGTLCDFYTGAPTMDVHVTYVLKAE